MQDYIFINSYDQISKTIIYSILKNISNYYVIPVDQNQVFPKSELNTIDKIMAEASLDRDSNIIDVQHFSAFQLKYKYMTECPSRKFRNINLVISPILRIQFLLSTWYNTGATPNEIISTLMQIMQSEIQENDSILNLYDVFYFFNHISNTFIKNSEAVFGAKLTILPVKSVLFILALAVVVAFDRLDIPSADNNVQFETIIHTVKYFNEFYYLLYKSNLDVTSSEYNLIAQAINEAQNILQRFQAVPLEKWQLMLTSLYLDKENLHAIENDIIPSQFFSLISRLKISGEKNYCFTRKFLIFPSLNIYYRVVPLSGLESTRNKDSILNDEIVKQVEKYNARILLDLSGEALTYDEETHTENMELHRILQQSRLPSKKIYFMCSNYVIAKHYSNWIEKNKINYPINMCGNNYWLYARSLDVLHDPIFETRQADLIFSAQKAIDKNEERPFYFMCLNLKARISRVALMLFFMDRNYFDKGIISYFGRSTSLPESYPKDGDLNVVFQPNSLMSEFVMQLPNGERLLSFYDKLERSRPIIYDKQENAFFTQDWPLVQLIPELAYHNDFKQIDSYFEIVTETYFTDEKALYVTEKTVRAIMRFQIFIMVGSPFTLKFLRSIGFQTFSPYINESYDEIINPVERMIAIMNEIDRLCSLMKSELHNIYCELWPRIFHNFQFYTQNMKQIYHKEINNLMGVLSKA